MKEIVMSSRTEWCKKIFNGEKTVEVRRTRPSIPTPFEVLVYETKAQFVKSVKGACTTYGYGRGKVIGSFVCDRIIEMKYNFCDHPEIGYLPGQDCGDSWWEWNDEDNKTCLTSEELTAYAGGRHMLYGWHITELKLFDKRRELSDYGLTRAPLSWCYVADEQ